MVDIEKLSQELSSLTIMEAADLVKSLEEKWGIQANVAAYPSEASNKVEETKKKESFDVILKDIGSKKIQVIKTVKEITSLGLKEAKALVDSAPKAIKTNLNEEEANKIKEKLEKQGATIELE